MGLRHDEIAQEIVPTEFYLDPNREYTKRDFERILAYGQATPHFAVMVTDRTDKALLLERLDRVTIALAEAGASHPAKRDHAIRRLRMLRAKVVELIEKELLERAGLA